MYITAFFLMKYMVKVCLKKSSNRSVESERPEIPISTYTQVLRASRCAWVVFYLPMRREAGQRGSLPE
jgi:hypothetical protein